MRAICAGATAAAALAAALLAGCAAPPAQEGGAGSVSGLRFIGEQRIGHRQAFQGMPIGGLSGIDYDPASKRWVMASDDRSEHGPARFYSLRLDYDLHEFRPLALDAVHLFRQADGSVYPAQDSNAAPAGEVADIESLRFDPQGDGLWYASEGNGALGMAPFIRHASASGAFRAALPLPAQLRAAPASGGGGVRNNLGFEALAFAPDGRTLWMGMEGPLLQDGPVASPEHGAMVRLSRFDRRGALLAQYAYPTDPVQGRPAPGRFGDNGVAEMLALDERRLLLLERSGVQDAAGRFSFHIRLYLLELDGASDVKDLPTLAGARYTPLRKRLVLNLNAAGLARVDNLEGMAWGPLLANGHRSLVFISDDNFDAGQVTQLLAFEVLP